MKVLFLVDEAFLTRERSLLERLAIGLGEEGRSVVWALADGQGAPGVTTLAQVVRYEPAPGIAGIKGAGWLAEALSPPAVRARDLARRLEETGAHTARDPVRTVHVWGERVWRLGAELALSLDAGIVFEVWNDALAGQARAVERRLIRVGAQPRMAWSAPAPGIARVLEQSRLRAPVQLARWGVHPSQGGAAWSHEDRAASIAVLAPGRDPGSTAAALAGLAQTTGNDGPMVFLDNHSPSGEDKVWREARGLSLLPRLTLVSDFEGRRDLPLRCDMLVLPERGLGMRSVALDAMACAMTLATRHEPAMDEIIDAGGVLAPQPATADGWALVFRETLEDRARARERAEASRAFVRATHTASGHAAAVAGQYASLEAGAALPTAV